MHSVPKTSEKPSTAISMVFTTIQALRKNLSKPMERVQYVVACNIQQKLHDGRISKENKTWALQSQMNQGEDNPKLEYTIHTHSGLLDLFANSIREQELTHEAEENMKEGDADEIEETDLDMQL